MHQGHKGRQARKTHSIMPLIALIWALGACSSDDGETLIFAASSLAAATDSIDAALQAEGSASPPEWVLAGSSRLIAQVRDGARPDVIVAADTGETYEDVRQRVLDLIPVGRYQTPEDVAKMVAFLASADADYSVGQAFDANGGAFFW